jgi:hypothetical protein
MRPTWSSLFRQHFVRFFGKPFDCETFQADNATLQIVTFDRPYKNYRIFASLGLSEYSGEVHDVGEVIVVADEAWRDTPFLLVNALFFMKSRRIALGSRVAVAGVETLHPEFAARYEKTALYISEADGFPPGFERIQRDNQIGVVYQGTFVSEAEYEFIMRKGGEAFEERFRIQEADLCSLRRPACV